MAQGEWARVPEDDADASPVPSTSSAVEAYDGPAAAAEGVGTASLAGADTEALLPPGAAAEPAVSERAHPRGGGAASGGHVPPFGYDGDPPRTVKRRYFARFLGPCAGQPDEVAPTTSGDANATSPADEKAARSLGNNNATRAWYMTDPNSTWRKYWDVWLAALILYNSIVVPLRIGFDLEAPLSSPAFFIDLLFDSMFIIDIVLNFFTGVVNDLGVVSYDHRQVASIYFRGWFWIDALSSLPFDLILELAGAGSAVPAGSNKLLRLLKIAKLLRMLRVARLARIMQRIRHSIGIKYSITTIVKFVFFILLLSHWIACGFALVALLEGKDDSWMADTIIPGTDSPLMEQSMTSIYIISIYHAIMVMSTIGTDIQPVTDLERIYSLITMSMGALSFAYGLTNVCSLIYNFNRAEIFHMQRIDEVQDFLKRRGLSGRLRIRVLEFYEHLKSRNRLANEESILAELSGPLAADVTYEMNAKLITSNAFFSDMPQSFVVEVIRRLDMLAYMPEDVIISEGERGSNMFFISEGVVEVFLAAAGNKHVATLKSGDYLGEIALLKKDCARTASVKALTFCDIYSLSRTDIEAVIRKYPAQASRWNSIAQRRLRQLEGISEQGKMVFAPNTKPRSASIVKIGQMNEDRSDVVSGDMERERHRTSNLAPSNMEGASMFFPGSVMMNPSPPKLPERMMGKKTPYAEMTTHRRISRSYEMEDFAASDSGRNSPMLGDGGMNSFLPGLSETNMERVHRKRVSRANISINDRRPSVSAAGDALTLDQLEQLRKDAFATASDPSPLPAAVAPAAPPAPPAE